MPTGLPELYPQTLLDSGMINTSWLVKLELKCLCLHLNFKVQVKNHLDYRINREQELSLMKDAVWSVSPEDRLCVTHSCFVAVAIINVMLTAFSG